jgi:hypothetical protein
MKIMFFVLPLLVLIASAAVSISTSAQLSDVGARLSTAQTKYEALHKQNESLIYTLAQKQSLSQMRESATKNGYTARSSVVTITPTTVIARTP